METFGKGKVIYDFVLYNNWQIIINLTNELMNTVIEYCEIRQIRQNEKNVSNWDLGLKTIIINFIKNLLIQRNTMITIYLNIILLDRVTLMAHKWKANDMPFQTFAS